MKFLTKRWAQHLSKATYLYLCSVIVFLKSGWKRVPFPTTTFPDHWRQLTSGKGNSISLEKETDPMVVHYKNSRDQVAILELIRRHIGAG